MTACRNPHCKVGQIIQGQYGAEGDEAFREREASGFCRRKCEREYKASKPTTAPRHSTLELTQVPFYDQVGGGIVSQPKPKTERSEPYKDFIKSLPCLLQGRFCECVGDVVPHHTEGGGTALKGSDFSCIPLCCSHHGLMDNAGKKGNGIWTREELKTIINRLHEAFNQQQADKTRKG